MTAPRRIRLRIGRVSLPQAAGADPQAVREGLQAGLVDHFAKAGVPDLQTGKARITLHLPLGGGADLGTRLGQAVGHAVTRRGAKP